MRKGAEKLILGDKLLIFYKSSVTVNRVSAIEAMKEYERAEGKAEMQKSIATGLIKLGQIAFEDIAKVCHLTLEQVKNLAATVNA
ncbi:MAG: hypothetical protein IJ697_03980 [Synergistaceae bacterium]|nr:hypothetical protein [Synergistaceae bacterium]